MKRWLAVALACLAAPQVKPAGDFCGHIPLAEFTAQSHRGAGALSPDNSTDAIALAWNLGTIPGADLRTTKAGVIVAVPINDLRRTLPNADAAMRTKAVEQLTCTEVARLDIGAWKGPKFEGRRIPRMADVHRVLATHPERRLCIDIESVNLVLLALENREVQRQLILASTKDEKIRDWMRLASGSATQQWMGGTVGHLATRTAELRNTSLADTTQSQPHTRADAGSPSPRDRFLIESGDELRRHGILCQARPMLQKTSVLFQELSDLDFASFATDFPDIAMRAVRDHHERNR